jgi:hypothetical protein
VSKKFVNTIVQQKEEKKKKDNNIHNPMQTTKDLVTRTLQKNRRELRYFKGVNSSCSTKGP